MFNQSVGDGANLFVIIISVVLGFKVALGYIDYLKTKKEKQNEH